MRPFQSIGVERIHMHTATTAPPRCERDDCDQPCERDDCDNKRTEPPALTAGSAVVGIAITNSVQKRFLDNKSCNQVLSSYLEN